MYEQAAEYDKAIERYRRILASEPTHAIALNNLAYALAVRKNQPAEALPLAAEGLHAVEAGIRPWPTRSAGCSTCWATRRRQDGLIGAAVKALPANGELRFHLAAVLAAIGSLEARRD